MLSDARGVEAIERISHECFRSFRTLPNAKLIDDGRVFGVVTEVPINFFSGIPMSVIEEKDVDGVIASMGTGPFRWWLSPSTRPVNLAEILASRGLQHTYDSAGMAIDLTVPLTYEMPSGFTVKRVTDLTDWERVFVEGFQRPDHERGLWQNTYAQCDDVWVHFVGYLDGAPVATTSLLLCGELVGVYHVVTLPQARGRGIGRAITSYALQYAQERGATYGALQASEMGYSVYEAIGFVDYCKLTLYARASSSATA